MGRAAGRALIPATPHSAAGMRMEPAVSVPTATSAEPTATATADPPLEPPGLRAGSAGLPVPGVVTPTVSGWVAVLPTMTAPAARSAATSGASAAAGAESVSSQPARVGSPATSTESLTATGMPCSGPRHGRPASAAAWPRARATSSTA